MTTETFSDTFKRSVNNTMKSFQDTTATVLDAHVKNLAFMNDICTQSLNTFQDMNKSNSVNAFTSPEKIMDMLRSNFERISNLSKSTLKTALEFGKQSASPAISKQTTDNIIETYNRQAENMVAFNQKYFDAITQHGDSDKSFFNSKLMEKSKRDFDANVELSKEQLHSIIDSYNKITNPSFESHKSFLNNISKQIDTMFDSNLKMWSDLMGSTAQKDQEPEPNHMNNHTNGNFNKKARTETKLHTN